MRALLLSMLVLLASQTHAAAIWHVQGEQDFYLFGTIHILKPDSYPLAKVYEQTLSQCDAYWFEIDLAEMNDPALMQEVVQKMMLPQGQTLKSQLSTTAYAQLEELADIAGLPLMYVQNLKPWAVLNQLTLQIFQNKGFTGEGLDQHIAAIAKAKNKPVYAFETLMWQLDMFEQMSQELGDDYIEFSTEDMGDIDNMIAQLYRHWQTGDVDAMYQQAQFDKYPGVEQRMLEDRNNAWMKTLLADGYIGNQCVVVGYLHMAGEHGLLQQFKQAGYKVTQLR